MIEIYGHPFSSYTWKVLIPLWENDTPFTFRMLGPDDPENGAQFARLWPVGKFPLLVDGDRVVPESTAIIDYLDAHRPGPVRFVPDGEAGLEARLMDRIFDNHVMANMLRFVIDAMKPPERRDPEDVAAAATALDTIYGWLDGVMASREWGAGDAFTLADCAAAPALFYADWVHPIPDGPLKAYRQRLLARPSVAKAVDGARPYRPLFPPGAPDRD
jgi:glutathione S-transferase